MPEIEKNIEEQNVKSENFSKKNMKNSSFNGSKLKDSHFTNTMLKGADFSSVDLLGTVFHNCDLCNADFSSSTQYDIDPRTNKTTKAKFSFPEAAGLLRAFHRSLRCYASVFP